MVFAQVASAQVELAQAAFALLAFVVASTVVASIVVAFTARAWRWASVLLRSAPLLSVLPPRVLTTGQVTMPPAIMALLPRSAVDTATITIRPTTAAYPRHSRCNMGDVGRAEANSLRSAEQSG